MSSRGNFGPEIAYCLEFPCVQEFDFDTVILLLTLTDSFSKIVYLFYFLKCVSESWDPDSFISEIFLSCGQTTGPYQIQTYKRIWQNTIRSDLRLGGYCAHNHQAFFSGECSRELKMHTLGIVLTKVVLQKDYNKHNTPLFETGCDFGPPPTPHSDLPGVSKTGD